MQPCSISIESRWSSSIDLPNAILIATIGAHPARNARSVGIKPTLLQVGEDLFRRIAELEAEMVHQLESAALVEARDVVSEQVTRFPPELLQIPPTIDAPMHDEPMTE